MSEEVSLSKSLIEEIEKLIREHPELGYKSVDEFVEKAFIWFLSNARVLAADEVSEIR